MLLGTLEVDAQDGSVDPRAIDHSIIALALAPGVQLPLRMSGWYAVQCVKVPLRNAAEVHSFAYVAGEINESLWLAATRMVMEALLSPCFGSITDEVNSNVPVSDNLAWARLRL